MRIPLLRTLSSRIVLGFAVLIATFGWVSGVTVHNQGLVSDDIRLLREGYSELALLGKDLYEKQNDLTQYLKNDLGGEPTVARAAAFVTKFRNLRDERITKTERVLAGLTDVPRDHARLIATVRVEIDAIRRDVAALAPMYGKLLGAPPLDKNAPPPGVPADPLRERQLQLLKEIQKAEQPITKKTKDFQENQNRQFKSIARNIERNEGRIRNYTLVLGLIAVLIGLLTTMWAVFTLRPLRRLRLAAGRIAEGDYASRIDERGPTEVADLAREFNVMGRAIEERERELVRSERLVAVGKMAAMITHEVRNPLSAIGLNTELLVEELAALPPERAGEAAALCRAITTEVDRLTAITEDYLQFARLPKPRVQPEPVEKIIRSLAEFAREDLDSRGVKLEVSVQTDLPRALADEGQLRQALLNLVRNAAESIEEVGSGTISIDARRGGPETVEIAVRDDGLGIPEEVQTKLFDPFFSTKQDGTGLGLALTHQIIREHGGSIRVNSRPGEGATFVMVIPAEVAAPGSTP